MKIEHKLTKDQRYGFKNEDRSIEFCAEEFRFYFKFGDRKTVFFLISDRKPRHGEAFKLERRPEMDIVWCFADLSEEEYAELNEDDSPWTTQFDHYLNDNFDINEPVYIWVEYE